MSITRAVFGGSLLVAAFVSQAFAQATFTPLTQASMVLDLTPDGRIAVGRSTLPAQAFYWSKEGGYTFIGGVEARAVSDDGSVIFGQIVGDPESLAEVAAVWTAEEGWQSIGGLPGGLQCPSISSSYELSADGTVGVGLGWQDGCDAYAFRWTPQTGMVGMDIVGDYSNRASAVSADGEIAGGFAHAGEWSRTPAMWFADGTGMLLAPTAWGEVRGVSDDGTVLLGDWNGEAFTWTFEGGMVTYGSLNSGWKGVAMDIADNGTIVGFDILGGSSRTAWIIPPGGEITNLRTYLVQHGAGSVPSLEVAQAISADGRVIGGLSLFGIGGWVATLWPVDPCPVDLDDSGVVDADDLAMLLADWGPNAGSPADLDHDAIVDAADLAILLGAWGSCV